MGLEVMQMARPGRKAKITDAVKGKIYAILATGGSLIDAADYLEIDPRTVQRAKKKDADFAVGVRKAKKRGKLRLIKKVMKANAWQAAAWMLERAYGSEFGRRELVRTEHTGKNGGPIKTENVNGISTDLAECSKRFEEFARRQDESGSGVLPPNRN